MTARPPGRLRWIARILVRGQNSRFITDDLEELRRRDRERGVSAGRTQWRYVRNTLASAVSVWRGGLRIPGASWLDVKLAGRMLVRHPGLTLVSAFALVFGIPAALAPLQLFHAINGPLPFVEGHRILGLQYWNLAVSDDRKASIHDFERWRAELTSFEPLAAARARIQNLVGDEGLAELVRGSEMTASGFAVTRVPPVLGRWIVETDEAPGAAPIVVIGYDLWQTRFGGDPAVLGRTLQFGNIRRTIVGVMPEGFLFPYRDRFWVPLQLRAADYDVGRGPSLWVFGRLRTDVSRKQAQAELTTIVQRMAADHPDALARLRPEVLPYQHMVSGLRANPQRSSPMFVAALLLLMVACGNVATLTFARVAARSSEIAVRIALGAGRGRIVMQMFIESLVLASLSAALGLALGEFAVQRYLGVFVLRAPFWFDLSVSPFTVAAAGGLAVFSAVIAGVVPALKATGKRAYVSLQRIGAGGSGLRFGVVSTLLIVAEVAIAVGGLSGVGAVVKSALRDPAIGRGIAAEEFLSARIRLPIDTPPRASAEAFAQDLSARFAAIQGEVSRQVAEEPGVKAVTFANVLPGMDHGTTQIEVEGADPSSRPPNGHTVRLAYVDPGFFSALEQSPLIGRSFEPRDLTMRGRPVVVNRSFVEHVLRGEQPVGRRIRQLRDRTQQPNPWYEIVGVVNDLGMNVVNPARAAGVYLVLAPGRVHPIHVVVHVAGDPTAFATRLRAILTRIDPALLLESPGRLDEVFSELRWQAQFSAVVFGLVAMIAVVLSAAGLYALMAFTVSERTQEIGIRTALGAQPARIVAVVAGRATLQLVIGVILGVGLGAMIVPELINSANQALNWRFVLGAVSVVMIVTGLLACAAPTLRALRIQPIDALRERN